MYKIDTIPFENYGMYISTHSGQVHLPVPKQQLFTVYGKEGYQITKREANILNLRGFIIANDITDFITKTSDLRALFSASGLRTIVLNNATLNCFAKEGFQIKNVQVSGKVYAKIQIKLTIV
jgi:hypothetical protein